MSAVLRRMDRQHAHLVEWKRYAERLAEISIDEFEDAVVRLQMTDSQAGDMWAWANRMLHRVVDPR